MIIPIAIIIVVMLASLFFNFMGYLENESKREKARAKKENKETLRLVAQAFGIDWNPYSVSVAPGVFYAGGSHSHTPEYLLREIVRQGTPSSEFNITKPGDVLRAHVSDNAVMSYVAARACKAGDVVEVLSSGKVAPIKARKARK